MKNRRISQAYAKVFFNKALVDKVLDNVLKDFSLLGDVFGANDKLTRYFISGLASREQKMKVIDLCKLHALSQKLIHILIKNNQMNYLGDIYDAMLTLNIESEGMVRATLLSPNKMSVKDVEACGKILGEKLGKKFSIEHKLDESIIGGVVLKFGSMMYDVSVRGAVHQLKAMGRS